MPKFRITADDGKEVSQEALDFESEEAAQRDAQRALVDMASEALPNGKRADFKIQIEAPPGSELYSASLTFRSRAPRKRRPK